VILGEVEVVVACFTELLPVAIALEGLIILIHGYLKPVVMVKMPFVLVLKYLHVSLREPPT
jgi:hypothetical protein